MVCFHSNYNLGDAHNYNQGDYTSMEELGEAITDEEHPVVMLPVYMYNHSGVCLNTTGFSCKWDSGQVGWIYINKHTLDEMGTQIEDAETYPEFKERLLSYLLSEVETYSLYVAGEVYGFQINDRDGEYEEGCSGFYGTNWKNNGLVDNVQEHVKLSTEDLDSL